MYIYFKEGKSVWSDKDYSSSDNTKYYKAPNDIETGYPCKLVDGNIMPFSEDEYKVYCSAKEKDILLGKILFGLKKECNKRIQTIPAKVRNALGSSNKDKYYSDQINWIYFYSNCQNYIIENRENYIFAKWVVDRISTLYGSYKENIKTVEQLTLNELEVFDYTNNNLWNDLPLP